MADLSELFKYAPTSAGFMLGQNNQQDRQGKALEQQRLVELINELKLKQSQSQDMHPLDMEAKRASIAGTQATTGHTQAQTQQLGAQLPGVQAESRIKGLNAEFQQATQPGAIGATNAGNDEKMRNAKLAAMNSVQDLFVKAAPIVSQVEKQSPGAGAMVLQKLMQDGGMGPDTPQGQMGAALLKSIPAGQLGTFLEKAAAQTNRNTPAYAQATDVENMQQAGALERQRISTGGTIRAAEIGAESRKAIADKKAQAGGTLNALLKSKNYAGAAAVASALAMDETDPADKQKYLEFASKMAEMDIAVKQAAANGPGKIDTPAIANLPRMQQTNPLAAPARQEPPIPQAGGGLDISQGPPPGAITKLRSNPSLAAAFDAKYGPGAAAKALQR